MREVVEDLAGSVRIVDDPRPRHRVVEQDRDGRSRKVVLSCLSVQSRSRVDRFGGGNDSRREVGRERSLRSDGN